ESRETGGHGARRAGPPSDRAPRTTGQSQAGGVVVKPAVGVAAREDSRDRGAA
ncbi:unnamed protein product, partial [Ectocarpus sp. 13 AM-2016]